MSDVIYRFEGIKITAGWQHPLTKAVIAKVSWLDSQTDEKLADLQITKHAKPVPPTYDEYYQRPVEQASGEYLIEDIPLDDVKQRKRDEINATRNQLETAGFLFMGKVFDSDQRSADRMQIAALAAQAAINSGAEYSVTWTTKDNSQIVLDAAGVLGMVAAFAAYGGSIFEQAKALKAQVDACTAGVQVKAMEWPE